MVKSLEARRTPRHRAADAAQTARRQNGHIYKENDRVRFDKTHDAIAFHLWPMNGKKHAGKNQRLRSNEME